MAPGCLPGRRRGRAWFWSAGLGGILLILAACAPATADPPAAIRYDATPRPIPTETLRPTFTRIRSTRIARTPTLTTRRAASQSSPVPVAPVVAPTEVPSSVDEIPAANPSDLPNIAPAAPTTDAAPGSSAPTEPTSTFEPATSPTPTERPPVGEGSVDSGPSATPVPPSATPRANTPTTAPAATATHTPRPTSTATPSSYPGQVSEDQGQYVTSRSSQYYYARDDLGWHRIQPENRFWFSSAADLLRAFPDRVFHAPTPTRTPTPVH
ncbi:MAG TPA: hypothetical protein VFZ25_01940 [Chloroflexota bacterium]|nr:hypothetical protein [Chloroflexota bacterium]